MPSQVSDAQKRVEGDGRFSTVGIPAGPIRVLGVNSVGATAEWRKQSGGSGQLRSMDATWTKGSRSSRRDIAGLVVTFTDRSTEISGTGCGLEKSARYRGACGGDTGRLASLERDHHAVTPHAERAHDDHWLVLSLKDLPPGEYFIAAVSDAAVDNWQEPKTLDSISRVGTRITLGEGGTVSQRLTTAVIR